MVVPDYDFRPLQRPLQQSRFVPRPHIFYNTYNTYNTLHHSTPLYSLQLYSSSTASTTSTTRPSAAPVLLSRSRARSAVSELAIPLILYRTFQYGATSVRWYRTVQYCERFTRSRRGLASLCMHEFLGTDLSYNTSSATPKTAYRPLFAPRRHCGNEKSEQRHA